MPRDPGPMPPLDYFRLLRDLAEAARRDDREFAARLHSKAADAYQIVWNASAPEPQGPDLKREPLAVKLRRAERGRT